MSASLMTGLAAIGVLGYQTRAHTIHLTEVAPMFSIRLVLLGVVLACATLGCAGAPGYSVDLNKVGTGEQAIEPRNDAQYWDGTPMDQRTRK